MIFKFIILLFLSINIYATNIDNYKEEVFIDSGTFVEIVQDYLDDKNLETLNEINYMIDNSNTIIELDYYTLIYLQYKQLILNDIMKQLDIK